MFTPHSAGDYIVLFTSYASECFTKQWSILEMCDEYETHITAAKAEALRAIWESGNCEAFDAWHAWIVESKTHCLFSNKHAEEYLHKVWG